MTEVKAFVVMSYGAEHGDQVMDLLSECGWHGAAIPSLAVLENAHIWGAAFVATNGQAVVGFARVVSDGQVVSYLSEIAVDAGWRGMGIGGSLLSACKQQFPNARLDLLSSELARGFYEHAGMGWHVGYRSWPK